MKFYLILKEDGVVSMSTFDDQPEMFTNINEAKAEIENHYEAGIWHVAEVNVVSSICIEYERVVSEL